MGYVGVSFILASVVYVLVRPPPWLAPMFARWLGGAGGPAASPRRAAPDEKDGRRDDMTGATNGKVIAAETIVADDGKARDALTMPPPPPPTIQEPDSPTTPRASVLVPDPAPIPTLTLSDESPASSSSSTPRSTGSSSSSAPSTSMMPPPPLPPTARLPTLAQFPAVDSPQRASRGPLPNRGAPARSPGAGGGLAPPPTHSAKPQKPSRQVTLDPGHSPLDWARISGPDADLRGLPRDAPYLRVTPSMLRRQTGRKGKDAWMAINGRVYNVTPYAKFHPGGVPELMRGAARDGSKLFGEVHPWVNYEAMLAACLVGLLVDEPEADAKNESEMDKMD